MKNISKEYKIVSVFFTVITVILFWQFFLKGLYPFPGNYMLAWYEPWKTDNTKGRTITIPHKPVADDTFRYIYPFKKLGTDMLKTGVAPLWNPYNGAGMPLLATYQWAPFSPFNILFIFLESGFAWTIYIVIQAFLLSFFTYLYCRKIHISLSGSIFSAIIFLFSGFVIARLVFGNLIYPLIALPFLLYLIEDFAENHTNIKKAIFIPIVIAFMLISGHPHITAYILIVSVFYLFFRILAIKKIIFIILLLLIGAGIACIQLIPTIELFLHSNMSNESSIFIIDRFLLPPYHLVSILISNYFGNQSTYNYWGASDYIESVAAIGLIPSFFAYLCFFVKNNLTQKYRLFFLIVVIVSILSAIDWFFTKILYSLPIPVISTSPPSRIFVLTTFSLSILAGYGFDAWTNVLKISKKIILKISPFLILVLAINVITFVLYKFNIDCHNELIPQCRLIALRNTFLETLIFKSMLILFFVYLKTKTEVIKKTIAITTIIIVFFIGIYNSNKFLPFSPKSTLFPNHVLIDEIKKKTNYDRVFGFGEANIKTNFATFFRIYDPQYYDPLYNKRYGELIAFANTMSLNSALSRSDVEIANDINLKDKKNESRKRLLDILGVKYFIYKKSQVKDAKNTIWQDKNWIITQNLSSLPRAYMVSNYEIISDKEKMIVRLFDHKFDLKKSVILEKNLPNIKYHATNNNHNEIDIIDYKENKVEIRSNSEENQILILTDNYYPGWKAYIDGKETKIYRANYTLRAINVPKGTHIIEFAYEPRSLEIGGIISVFSLFILLFIFFRPKISSDKDKR